MNLGILDREDQSNLEYQMRGIFFDFAFRLLRHAAETIGGFGSLQPIEVLQPIEIDVAVLRTPGGLTTMATRADRMYARALYRDLEPVRLARVRAGATRV